LKEEDEPIQIRPEQNRICSIFKNWNTFKVRRGAALFAFSSTFHASQTADDGNLMLIDTINPLTVSDWSRLTEQLVRENRLPNEHERWNVRELTGLLPRELHRFCKAWNIAKQSDTGDNKQTVTGTYLNLAVEYFKIRIQRLLDRHRLGNAVEDSTIFAAKVFMGSEMWDVPESWKVSGMVFFYNSKYRLVCPPAEQAVYEAFDDEHLRNAIVILREDENIRWRILELCVQHRFRKALLAGAPVFITYQNLARDGDEHQMRIVVNKIIRAGQTPSHQIHLEKGTMYICERGHAVIDFFIYDVYGEKVWMQVSESAYREHHTKYEDLFRPMIIMGNSIYDFYRSATDSGYQPSGTGQRHLEGMNTTYISLRLRRK
jgi:hypothetical protein